MEDPYWRGAAGQARAGKRGGLGVDYTSNTTDVFSDAELITSVRAGDREAFGTLYARHSAAATRLARQFASSPAEADDVVSEAFAKVLDTLLDGRGPDTAFRAYLFTTLRHTAIDRGRKDSKLQFTDDLTAHETPEIGDDPVLLDAENALVAKAFGSLPERWQTVLWHTQVEQESPTEVGMLLGMTPNAVTSLAFRAREGLREAYLQAHLSTGAAAECRTTVDRLGSWARDGLSKREQAQVDAHLERCDDCRALAAELTEINSSLRMVLAPIILGGAAVGYLATSSSTVAAALLGGAAGTAGGATSAAAGSSSAGNTSFWSSPWAWVGTAAAAVVAVVAIVVTLPGGDAGPQSAAAVGASNSSGPQPSSPAVSTSGPAHTKSTPSEQPAPQESDTQPPATSRDTSPTPTTRTSTSPAASTPPAAPGTVAPAPAVTVVRTTAPVAPPATPATPSSAAPPPAADAELSAPVIDSAGLHGAAGGSTAVRFSVTNSGGSDSTRQSVELHTPAGVTVAAGTATTAPAGQPLRSAALAFVTPRIAPHTASGDLVTCTDDSHCHYIVPAHTTVTITLTLGIAPDASAGNIRLMVNGAAGPSVALTVAPGLEGVTIGTAQTVFRAGSTIPEVPITGILADGVTDPGPITLPLRTDTGGFWITGYPDTCTSADAESATITCPLHSADDGAADFGTFAVSVLPGAAPEVTLSAALPGGRSVAVGTAQPGTAAGDTDATIAIEPRKASDAITLTGPFGGTIVGGTAMECPTPHTTRGNCSGNMQTTTDPQSLTIPDGATVISATLTWAMTYPDGNTDNERAQNLSRATLHAAPPNCTADPASDDSSVPSADCTATHEIDPDSVQNPTVDEDCTPVERPRSMYVRSTDVTRWVTSSSTVWVDGLHASLKPSPCGTTPMAGWVLSVIWSDPSAHATVDLRNPGTYSLSGTTNPVVPLAEAGSAIDSLSLTVWAADPQSDKAIVAGDEALPSAPIWGVRPDAHGDYDHGHATGFDLVTVSDVPKDTSVTFSNEEGVDPAGHWANQVDGLWLGPTMIQRSVN